MAQESTLAPLGAFCAQHERLIEWLHDEAKAARWGLSRDRFAETLRGSAEKRFGSVRTAVSDVESYLKSLHLEDLALASACADGIEEAWEFFVAQYRQGLRIAARAILCASGAGDAVRAEELADSLYAELYGVTPTGSGRRKSLFEYFHGRSKLSTWLRAVLAQRHVDLLRTSSRTVSLEREQGRAADEVQAGSRRYAAPLPQFADSPPLDPNRERYLVRIDRALSAAIAGLAQRERMLLAFYYVDQLTLAEIGRTLGEHESTVSRQLDRTRQGLRQAVTQSLLRGQPAKDGQGAEPGLDEAQVDLAFEYAIEDWSFNLSSAISGHGAAIDSPEG